MNKTVYVLCGIECNDKDKLAMDISEYTSYDIITNKDITMNVKYPDVIPEKILQEKIKACLIDNPNGLLINTSCISKSDRENIYEVIPEDMKIVLITMDKTIEEVLKEHPQNNKLMALYDIAIYSAYMREMPTEPERENMIILGSDEIKGNIELFCEYDERE